MDGRRIPITLGRTTMRLLSLLLLLASGNAFAQCVSNVDTDGNLCSNFTLGAPTVNCIAIATQDGVPASGGAVCPSGFFGGGSLQVELPNDPVSPGSPLLAYTCTAAQTSDTHPTAPAAGATRTVTESLDCPGVNYSWYTAEWFGSLTFNYNAVKQTHCSGGKGGGCHTGYFWVWASGSGEMFTAQPPPMPPPPPQPVETDLTSFLIASCDPTVTCVFQPADQSVVSAVILFGPTLELFVAGDINQPLDVYSLNSSVAYTNYLSSYQVGDDGCFQTGSDDPCVTVVYGGSEIDDAYGNPVKQVSFSFTETTDVNGNVTVSGVTISVIAYPPVVQ